MEDTRNVLDKYKNQPHEDIVADLDSKRISLEIAVENLKRDFSMGTIVRTANAFNVAKVHIIGRKSWNKRGAMATDKYMNIEYHASVADFLRAAGGRKIIAIDIVPAAKQLNGVQLPNNAVLVFGAEGSGLSQELLDVADQVVQIEQFGSTRSMNVAVAAGIAMYEWVRRHML